MEFSKKVKATLALKQENLKIAPAKEHLNKYMLSQFFIQLVNFQQLIKSMNEFVGDDKQVLPATLLNGLSLCLNETLSEMIYDRYDTVTQLEMIKTGMEKIGVKTTDIRIKSLYPRLLKFSMIIDKPSPELLSGQIKAQLEAQFRESLKINVDKIKNKTMKLEITSSRNFKIEHGVAYVGKHGNKISGDNYLCDDFQNGTAIIAISDGMGNGEVAHTESQMALQVLKCMLNFDVPVTEAIRVIAELKQQSNADERFFSLDLCVIDKENHHAHFYKQAATTTFLRRGDAIHKIEMSGLPIGAVDGAEIDQISVDLVPGDLLIMCSDGVVDAYQESESFEVEIMQSCSDNVSSMAQNLLDYTIKQAHGKINDDMMIVVASYKKIRKR